jgi:hypothetical protein
VVEESEIPHVLYLCQEEGGGEYQPPRHCRIPMFVAWRKRFRGS